MIDWLRLVATSLSLVGLALLMAALSHAWWLAHQWGGGLRAALSGRAWGSGLALVCAGLALGGPAWWQRLLWGAAALSALGIAWRAPQPPVSGDRPRRAARWPLPAVTPVDLPVAVMALWLPVTLWASADRALSYAGAWRLLGGIALFYAVAGFARSPGRLAAVAALAVLLGAGLALLAPLAVTAWPAGKLFGLSPLLAEDVNPNVLAGGLALVWPLVASLGLARYGGGRWRVALVRAGLAAALLLVSAVLVLTQSRGAWLALALGALVALGLRWPWAWLSLPAAVLAADGALLAGAGPRLLDSLCQTGTITSWAGREEIWSRALLMIEDFPFTGIGLATFDRVQPLLYPLFTQAGREVHHAHNLFLQVAVDLGLVGLVAYLALLLGGLHAAWQAWRQAVAGGDGWLPALALGLVASLVVLVAHGALDAAVWGNKLAPLPWLILGLAVALYRYTTERIRIGRGRLCNA